MEAKLTGRLRMTRQAIQDGMYADDLSDAADQMEEQEDDDPGPVLCECGTTEDLLHDCDAADRTTEK